MPPSRLFSVRKTGDLKTKSCRWRQRQCTSRTETALVMAPETLPAPPGPIVDERLWSEREMSAGYCSAKTGSLGRVRWKRLAYRRLSRVIEKFPIVWCMRKKYQPYQNHSMQFARGWLCLWSHSNCWTSCRRSDGVHSRHDFRGQLLS